ncbi:keratin-associated protein 15-1 [Marmota marmota marmota]|uniref:Keratin-associated protein n=1 Tax=Marmota marmota marmota TaxID=9994 RepID=A0A8C5ZV44_MARMA|nr:keratin-associated protein 15-1 [Marmota marmota marmota]
MSYNCGSGRFSSQSLGSYLRYPVSQYNSFYPSDVAYSPGTYQLGSSFYGGHQESYSEPISYETSCPGTRSYQTSSYCPKNFIFSSPCQANYSGSLGYGSTGHGSFGFGSTGFQSVGCGSSFHRPAYFPSRSCQSTCFRPAIGSHYFGSSY